MSVDTTGHVHVDSDDEVIKRMLARTRRIAIVGLSASTWRASHGVAKALQRDGYEIVPVNPGLDEVLGEKAYATLADIPGKVDLVDVFRREEHLPGIARAAAAIGSPALFVQQGLISPEARAIAAEAGMDYIEDRCLKVEVSLRQAKPASD
jgi:predicted CoA-binding protein